MADNVNSPSHYKHGRIETIEAIEDWKLGYHLGNVVKYVSRAGRKGDRLEDLRKAQWYLAREIGRVEETLTGPDVQVGAEVRCLVSSRDGSIVEGSMYRVAQVSNGDRCSFLSLEGAPVRYWDTARFEVTG